MDIFADIAGLFVRLLIGLLRLIMRIIGFAFSKTWIANHAADVRRWGVALVVVATCYLAFGIIRAAVPVLATPSLTLLYQWQMIAIALIACLVGFAMSEWDVSFYDPDATRHAFHPEDQSTTFRDGPIDSDQPVHNATIVALLVALAIIGAGVSAAMSKRHETSLAEKLCAQADARIPDGLDQTIRDGAGLIDSVFGTQTSDAIPCADD